MARIRSIKPEFFTSEQVVECSTSARLLFIGLWCFCDDAGIHPASAKRAKMEVFPGDDLSNSDVEGMIEELKASGLLLEFEVENQRFWKVTGWERHQKIDRPSYRYPTPDRGEFVDDSVDTQRVIDDDHPPESSRVEGSRGENHKGYSHTPQASKGYPDEFESCWKAYPKRHRPPNKKAAFKAWNARIRDGHLPETILAGVNAYHEAMREEGNVGTNYVKDPKTFFGPDEHFLMDWGDPDPWAGKNYIHDDGHGRMWQRDGKGEWFLLGDNPETSDAG